MIVPSHAGGRYCLGPAAFKPIRDCTICSRFHVAVNVSLWSATGKLPRASLMSSALGRYFGVIFVILFP
jgi:hypothetical protein